ncbi:MAG TPA: hypothetical protein VKU80_15985 [Planctomycetota bacterium]|nr:hypothetical protein [Planctomycetota bacterium]
MDEGQSDVDKEEVLREIAGAIPMDEAPLPDLPPPEPIAAESVPEADSPPTPSGLPPRPSWWSLHRHEMAGLVTALVSLVWISLGVAMRAWGPSLIGLTFALGALLIGTQAVWAAD